MDVTRLIYTCPNHREIYPNASLHRQAFLPRYVPNQSRSEATNYRRISIHLNIFGLYSVPDPMRLYVVQFEGTLQYLVLWRNWIELSTACMPER